MSDSRVRVIADQRINIPEWDALQELIYESNAKILGAFLGIGSGCLTLPVFDTTFPDSVSVGPCVLVGSEGVQSNLWTLPDLIVAVHDPSKAWQPASGIDLSVWYPTGKLPWIWFRRLEKASDEGNIIAYDAASQREKVSTSNTRYRKYVLFGASNSRTSPPTSDSGWYPFAKVVSWSGSGVPSIQPVLAWDRGHIPVSGQASDALWYWLTIGDSPEGTVQTPGLFNAIRALFLMLKRSIDSTFAASLVSGEVSDSGLEVDSPDRGSQQLHTALAAVETILSTAPVPLAWGTVPSAGTKSGASFVGMTKYAAAAADDSKDATGTYTIRCRGEVKSVMLAKKVTGAPASDKDIGYKLSYVYPDSAITVYCADGGALDDQDFSITAFGSINA